MLVGKIDLNEDFDDFSDEWYNNEYEKCFVDLDKKVGRPETLISIGTHTYKGDSFPTSVMTLGEFSVLSAPSKSKKSFLKSFICSVFIGGKSDNFFINIKGHRKEDCFILDFDTEQAEYYSSRTFNRVRDIVGEKYPLYMPFKLRHLSPEERVTFIERTLRRFKDKMKLVFIDGIADLINDVNNLEQANYIVSKLMNWTDVYNIHICTIIHNAYGEKKPTGHLGSAVTKKAETTIQLIPMENDIVKVWGQYVRGYPFEEFYFCINKEDSLPYECDEKGNILTKEIPFFNKNIEKQEKEQIPLMLPNDSFGTKSAIQYTLMDDGIKEEEDDTEVPF